MHVIPTSIECLEDGNKWSHDVGTGSASARGLRNRRRNPSLLVFPPDDLVTMLYGMACMILTFTVYIPFLDISIFHRSLLAPGFRVCHG